jgi:hypothetical protein
MGVLQETFNPLTKISTSENKEEYKHNEKNIHRIGYLPGDLHQCVCF